MGRPACFIDLLQYEPYHYFHYVGAAEGMATVYCMRFSSHHPTVLRVVVVGLSKNMYVLSSRRPSCVLGKSNRNAYIQVDGSISEFSF